MCPIFHLVSFSSIKNWTRALSKIGRAKKNGRGVKKNENWTRHFGHEKVAFLIRKLDAKLDAHFIGKWTRLRSLGTRKLDAGWPLDALQPDA